MSDILDTVKKEYISPQLIIIETSCIQGGSEPISESSGGSFVGS